MTLSPTRNFQPKRSTSGPPAGGLSTACSRAFSACAPSSERFIGVRTCTSRNGSRPKRCGMRSRTIVTMRSTTADGSFASTK